VAVLLVASACSRPSGQARPSRDGSPRIELNHSSAAATVDVVGLAGEDISRLERDAMTPEQWTALLRIDVAGSPLSPDRPAVLGSYSVTDGILRFTPRFPFVAGQRYAVAFDPSRLPSIHGGSGASGRRIESTIEIPAPSRAPTTRVVEVYPTAPEVPENQLRLYITFSAPMGLGSASPYVQLLDDRGAVLADPFLPLDVDLWNEDRTRYTVLFDPGRVKRGILPNEEMGRPLAPGRKYALVVDGGWLDGEGQPLVSPFRREFRVGPAEERAIDPAAWRLEAPRDGTRDPLVVSFPRPLDYGLLLRAFRVASEGGARVDGDIEVQRAETRWIFTPRTPWPAGEYRLVAASTLEDVAGNRIGRPFEVDASNEQEAPRATNAALPFHTRPLNGREPGAR
jgi:hypothetical protein